MPEYAQFEFVIISFPFIAGLALEGIRRVLPYLVDFFLDTLLPFFYIRFIPMRVHIIHFLGTEFPFGREYMPKTSM